MPSSAWMERANCIGMDPERFFPIAAPELEILATCAACPVRQECADYADAEGLGGIWGGTTERERRGRTTYTQGFCRNGHPRTPDSVRVLPNGRRRCVECYNTSTKRSNEARRARREAARVA